MTAKRVVLTAQATLEVRQATAWYRKEGGSVLAQRWVAALETALRRIGAHPEAGPTRYAVELKLDGLRYWPVKGFPYLVFYIEHAHQIDVGRVLHEKRDIPAWLGDAK